MVIKRLIKNIFETTRDINEGVSESVTGLKEKIKLAFNSIPKHVAFDIEDGLGEAKALKELIFSASKLRIPVMTFNLLKSNHTSQQIDTLVEVLSELLQWQYLQENQFKVSVLGRWYNLPARLVEKIKELVAATKDYDKFFLNLCINYDGQEEIVEACKLIAKQVELGRISPEGITNGTIKEHLWTSYFIPPELIIKVGKAQSLDGFLLWDSAGARIFFANKPFGEFTKEDFLKAIEWTQKQNKVR
ncbi:MAG: undecaprenyl diphosphate synthase family protein [Candidatus Woesearchaeota archaeon]